MHVLASLNNQSVVEALKDMTSSKYVTYKITWYYEKFRLEILNESQELLTESVPYQSSSSGDFGFEIQSIYLG